MDVKTAIDTGDAAALRRLLAADPALANTLIRWGKDNHLTTHPLHYVSDMLFEGKLQRGKELPLLRALIKAGADLDFQKGKSDTPLIGAASLGAEAAGILLLEAGAKPGLTGLFGETALHWAAMMGEARLVAKLIPHCDLTLKDERYQATPLGWATHGASNPKAAASPGRHRKVIALLTAALPSK